MVEPVEESFILPLPGSAFDSGRMWKQVVAVATPVALIAGLLTCSGSFSNFLQNASLMFAFVCGVYGLGTVHWNFYDRNSVEFEGDAIKVRNLGGLRLTEIKSHDVTQIVVDSPMVSSVPQIDAVTALSWWSMKIICKTQNVKVHLLVAQQRDGPTNREIRKYCERYEIPLDPW